MLEGETVTGGIPILLGLSGIDLSLRTRVPGGLGMRIYDPLSETAVESKQLTRTFKGINTEVARWRAGVPGARNPAGWRWREPDSQMDAMAPPRMVTFADLSREIRAERRARIDALWGSPRPYDPDALRVSLEGYPYAH